VAIYLLPIFKSFCLTGLLTSITIPGATLVTFVSYPFGCFLLATSFFSVLTYFLLSPFHTVTLVLLLLPLSLSSPQSDNVLSQGCITP